MHVYVYIWIGYGVGVDVWAMGVILFVLLSGFPPFRSPDRNQEELFRLIQKGEVHFLSPYWDNVSEGEILNSFDPLQKGLLIICHHLLNLV